MEEAEVMKTMSGHDPCTTVIVSLRLKHLIQIFNVLVSGQNPKNNGFEMRNSSSL